MRTYTTDYLVIGGGLAGSTLGFLLRQAGANVIVTELLDARAKSKLCGGIIASLATKTFETVYGTNELLTLQPLQCQDWTTSCFESSYTIHTQYPIVQRKDLDDYCLKRYLDSDGILLDRVKTTAVNTAEHTAVCLDLRTKEHLTITYNTLVAADGATSLTRRMLTGRKARFVLTLEGTVPNIGNYIEFNVMPQFNGYCWYIPRREDAQIGCIYQYNYSQGRRERLRNYCNRLGLDVPRLRSAPVPSGDDILLSAQENTWFIGDAAGLADAFGGGGIHYALVSAQLLANSLLGSTPYTQAMEPHLQELKKIASTVDQRYLAICIKAALTRSDSQQN